MNQVDYALEYLNKGYSIIPCRADKKPFLEWEEFQTRRPTEAEVLAWWGKHPEANIGIICGPISGLTVVDCDSPEAWEGLDEYLPDSLMAPVSLTPTGNHQIFFKHKPGLHSQNRVMNETDIKTDGGYVIAPPSNCEYEKNGKHIKGGHSWKVNGIEPPEMPPELAYELEKRQVYLSTPPGNEGAKKPEGWRDELFIGVPEGQRNDTAAKLAGDYIRRGLSDPEVLALLTEWNTRNLPPLDERELQSVVASIRKTDSRKTPPADPEPINETPGENPWTKAVIDFDTLRSIELPERRTFLFPWLTEQSMTLVYSWRGTGKSFFILGIINAVTRGEKFGPWEAVEPVPCLYLDAEMPAGMLQERAEEMGIGRATKAPARLISMNYALDLGLPRKNLIDPEWRGQLSEILISGGYKLFFVDNISSLTPEIEENAKQAWDVINQWALELRFRGVSTVLLHHAGKSGAQRGTSGREDNVDTSILLKRPADFQVTDGCRFVCVFEKDRCTDGRQLLAEYEFQYQDGLWTFANSKTKGREQVLKLLDQGKSQKQVADELSKDKGWISRVRREAINSGWLTAENKLTQSGFCGLLGAQPESTGKSTG